MTEKERCEKIMIKSIIVDDEQYVLEEIAETIKDFKEIQIIETTNNPKQALEFIKKNEVQLAFLDIEMPEINGLVLAEKILNVKSDIEIVFITAYNHYACDAFEANAIDYVLKPIKKERLVKTLNKILKVIEVKHVECKPVLKVKAFKKFRAFVNEELIKWRTAKDGELLAYLIENVNIPIHKEKLAEEMWNQVDVKNALIYLQSSIYRLRKFFSKNGYDNPIIYANNCYVLNEINIDCDLWSYNKFLNNDYIISDNNVTEYEELVALYDGNYLEEDGYFWSIDLQEELKHKYLELLKK